MQTKGPWLSEKSESLYGRVSKRDRYAVTKMTFVIMSPCVDIKDGRCVDVCPVDCIYEGSTMFYIHPEECIACALCETVCPVDAIRHIEDVPDQEKTYVEKNAAFFSEGNS